MIKWKECEGGGAPHYVAQNVVHYRKTFRKVYRRIPYGSILSPRHVQGCGIDAPFGFIPWRLVK